ncbi:lytic transglycosylase domain-containing protein [Clostridium sediminicola]|uniref:lytic transglycosylase domain-containing protein n=1 Tax=Clostridium sediminicola TaxID=3114879 RepID=UPI0031F1E059
MKFLRKIILILLLIIILLIGIRYIAKQFYPMKYQDYVMKYSKAYEVDPFFIYAVIKAESNFKESALSSKGASGLMQITPSTARWAADVMGKTEYTDDILFRPEFNIEMGCWYINNLRNEFGNNNKLILAAYNGGRGNVKKWLSNKAYSKDGKNLDNIPFGETDKYIKKVEVNYNIYKYLYCNDKSLISLVEEILEIYFKL